MKKPKVCVLRTAGTNCDKETAFAFAKAGARVELVHINALVSGAEKLHDYEILALPGGFTYGDDIASGKIFANELRSRLSDSLTKFIRDGRLVIGICNGFQILVKAGFLPGNARGQQDASLIINDCGSFRDLWVSLRAGAECVWTKGLPQELYLPIAHGEGKFVTRDKKTLERIKRQGQVVLRYVGNPNGSVDDIAGICDKTGRVLGLMPHPERHLFIRQHPRWEKTVSRSDGHGMLIFKNGVDYAKKNL